MQSIDQEGKTVEEALEKALSVLNRTRDEVDYEVLDEGSKGVLGVGARPILVRVRAKEIPELTNVKNLVANFLTELGISVNALDVNLDKNDIVKIDLDTDDAGILIGKHGQTLEALQYIVNQVMHETKFKFMVDISSYREKQNSKLIETVKKIASSVLQSKRRITLKPMTAFERRMVHETVKEFPDLATKSIGMEPRRRVVISLLNAPDYDSYPSNERSGNSERPQRSYNSQQGGDSGQGGYRGNSDRPARSPNYNSGDRPQRAPGSGYNSDRPARSPNYNSGDRPQRAPGSGYNSDRPARTGGYNNNGGGNRPARSGGYNAGRPGYNNSPQGGNSRREPYIEPGNQATPSYNENGPDPNNV
jgi:spoIIIJ-associated protein